MATKLEELRKQIEELQKQQEELISKEKTAAIEDINIKIKTLGIRIRDLDFSHDYVRAEAPREKSKVAVKYRKGINQWTGRGRKPKWVEEHVASGGHMDELLVK